MAHNRGGGEPSSSGFNLNVMNDSRVKHHLEQVGDPLLVKGGMCIDGRCERTFERGVLLESKQDAIFCVTNFAYENLLVLFV